MTILGFTWTMGVTLQTGSKRTSRSRRTISSVSTDDAEPEHEIGLQAVDLQLIRLRILHQLNWPIKTRHFVTCVAARAYGRNGWFPSATCSWLICSEFMGRMTCLWWNLLQANLTLSRDVWVLIQSTKPTKDIYANRCLLFKLKV
jgi:hypothetical protein